jgi:hypothetical protein
MANTYAQEQSMYSWEIIDCLHYLIQNGDTQARCLLHYINDRSGYLQCAADYCSRHHSNRPTAAHGRAAQRRRL